MISIEKPHTYRDLKAAIAKFPVIQVDEKEEEDVDATASYVRSPKNNAIFSYDILSQH